MAVAHRAATAFRTFDRSAGAVGSASASARASSQSHGFLCHDIGIRRQDSALPITIITLRRGIGRDAGTLIEVSSVTLRDARGAILERLIDTVVVGANDLRLRSSRSLAIESDGTLRSDIRALVASDTLIVRQYASSGGNPAHRTALNASLGAPYVTPLHVIRAAPLSTTWRASYPVFIPGGRDGGSTDSAVIDSVRLTSVRGSAAWVVRVHVQPDMQWIVTVDSLTRDLMSCSVGRQQQGFAMTLSNLRTRGASDAPAPTKRHD